MKILVDCRSIHPGKSQGIENFAYSVIDSTAKFVEEVVVDVCKTDLQFYRNYFKEHKNIAFVSDPVQGFFISLNDSSAAVRAVVRILGRMGRLFGFNLFARRVRWAKEQQADVVYYPYHRDEPQHKHIPMVTTVHAILPEYGKKEMDVISEQMKTAAAIVTSWPHPFKELSQRYPFAKDRLFLVPYTARQNVETAGEYDISQLGINGQFYFYPSVIGPRKNHINLIKAYGRLREKEAEAPIVVFSGGGDAGLTNELVKTAENLRVGEKFMFLGYVPKEAMAGLYRECKAVISSSFWEAGSAVIQEGGMCGKPVICSNIEPAKEHAKLFGLDVCFFDPANPKDIADKIIEFESNIDRYRQSSVKASPLISSVDEKYMGKCYSDIFRYAAGQAPKPEWSPFLNPRNQ